MDIKNNLKRLLTSNNPFVKKVACAAYDAYRGIRYGRAAYWIRYKPYMDDEKYLKKEYKKRLGVELNLDQPVTFNEKNNWRKLHDRRPAYTDMVDKYKFKDYVTKKAGDQYVIPLLGVWDSPDQIDYTLLPDQFVLKANHNGGVIICRDKASFDIKKANKELKDELHKDYFAQSREWPYKNVNRKVICEKYMGENLSDFKNYCFNGKLMYTFVWENRSRADGRKPDAVYCGAYDRDWNKADIKIGYESSSKTVERPACYEELCELAEKLSEGIPFVRVDCYIIDGHLYAGEMTFFPWGGFMEFQDEKWNHILGEMEKLPLENCGGLRKNNEGDHAY